MNRKSLERKEHNINISLLKSEPNASIWGCLTGKNKWSDFLKPQISGQSYNVDLNLQTSCKDKKLHSTRKKKACMKQLLESREKKMAQKIIPNEGGKPPTHIYVKNLISNSTFATNIPIKRSPAPRSPRQNVSTKVSLPIYKMKKPKSEKCSAMQLKFRENVLHLYNVNGMKHKKVILQGVPESNIYPNLMKQNKLFGFRPIFLNPLKKNKTYESVRYNENESCVITNKYKQKSYHEPKNNTEEQMAIPQLLSKIQSMEQQIQSLENTTKKIDEEVTSAKSLSARHNNQVVHNVQEKKKSAITVSYNRTNPLSFKKTSNFFRKKLKGNKLLKKGLSKTSPKMNQSESFKDSKTKSKPKLNNSTVTKGYQPDLFSDKNFELLAENLKRLIQNKTKDKLSRQGTIHLKPLITSECQKSVINLPEPNQVSLSSKKLELEQIKCNEVREGEVLETGNITINREHSLKINTFSHSTENHNYFSSPETDYINILRNSLELKKVKGKPQEIPTESTVGSVLLGKNEFLNYSSQQASVESCFDPRCNRVLTNEGVLPMCSSNFFEAEFVNEKCENESITLLNRRPTLCEMVHMHESNQKKQVENKEKCKPDAKFNITIFINEKDKNLKDSNILSKYDSLSLIESHVYNTEMSANTVTEIHQSQNIKLDTSKLISRNYQTFQLSPEKEKIKPCYKPVSCPGELDKVKMKYQLYNSCALNKNESVDDLGAPPPVALSDNHLQKPLDKPYISRNERKAIERNFQKQYSFSDSFKYQNLFPVKRETNYNMNTLPRSKPLETNNDKYGKYNYSRKNINDYSKFSSRINGINTCNIPQNDYRMGDTAKNIGHVNVLNCYQSSLDKTIAVNKPFSSRKEIHMKNVVRRHQGDQRSYYCQTNMISNITPYKYSENNTPRVETKRKNIPGNINTEKYKMLSETINYKYCSKINNRKEKINLSIEDLKNQSICQQFMQHAGKTINEFTESNWSNNGKCNVKLISIFDNNTNLDKKYECSNTLHDTKTSYGCMVSSSSASRNKNENSIILNNNKKKTIKIKLSALFDEMKNRDDSESEETYSFELGKRKGYENFKEILPVKKCEAMFRMNNQEDSDLKKYFSKLSNSHKSDGISIDVDSGYDSSKNKQEELIGELVTCIKDMTMTQGNDKDINGSDSKETEQDLIEKKSSDSCLKENITILKNETDSGEDADKDKEDSVKDRESKLELVEKKCEYCLNCQGKLSDSNKTTNSSSENENCITEEHNREYISSINSNSFTENNTDNDCRSNDTIHECNEEHINYFKPIVLSPSEIDLKMEKENTAKESFEKSSNGFYNNNVGGNPFALINNNTSIGYSKEQDTNFNKKQHIETTLRPVVMSSSSLCLSKRKSTLKINSPSPLQKISLEAVEFYNLQTVINNAYLYSNRNNNNTDFSQSKNNSIAFLTSPSEDDLKNKLRSHPNIVYSINSNNKENQFDQKLRLSKFDEQNDRSNTFFKNIQNLSLTMTTKVNQVLKAKQFNFASKSVSASSVLKPNKIKNKSDVRLTYSESSVCFPKISSCSSSNSTLRSSEYMNDSAMGSISVKTRYFLQDLKQKIESMKDSSEQCIGQCQMMMDLYDNARELQKISSEWINCFIKVNKTISNSCDTDMMQVESKSDIGMKSSLSNIETQVNV